MPDLTFWNGVVIGLVLGMIAGASVGVLIMAALIYRGADREEGEERYPSEL